MSCCGCGNDENKGYATFKGNPLTLVGSFPRIGMPAPDFQVIKNDLSVDKLTNYKGKTVLISVVPSLDTGVCDAQTRKFNEEASKIPGVVILTISMDLPFAQARWCGAAGVKNLTTLSDHKDADFGLKYGVLIKELRLLDRAVFVVDKDGKIKYQEILKEMTSPPNYQAALDACK